MSDVDWEFESTQQQIPQGQLFSRVEMESRAAPDDPLTRRIFRVHFLQEALDALDSLSKHAKTQRAADYANVLFKAMRVIRDTLRHDPFSPVIIALHDALAYKNRWAEYTTAQYQQARDVLVKYGNQDLPANKALKAISSLETIGFDTTPFEAFTELEDNNSKASEGD